MDSKYTELIERYFDGIATAAEKQEVEKLKENDKDFQEEYQLFESAHFIVELDTLQKLKENARKLDQEIGTQKPKSNASWMKIAASILLIAVVGSLFYAQQYSNENLYNDNYAVAKDYVSDLGSENNELSHALRLYNKKNYSEAMNVFAAIESKEPLNQEAKFYLGQCLLQLDKTTQAIKTLSEVSGDYRAEALWYSALAYLKTEDEENCLKQLDLIVENEKDQAFVLKATELKNKLSNPIRKFVF